MNTINYRIDNSYLIKSKNDMEKKLQSIKNDCSNTAVNRREISSMISEWRAHNLLYDLHLFRKHTADVDFEYPQKIIMAVIYFILSCLYPHK